MATALVRRPGPRLAEGIVTHAARRPVDVALAHEQWLGYVAAFAAAGWETAEVEPADDSPDAVFVEDALVVVGGVAVVTRPGAPSRRSELQGAERAAASRGYAMRRIEEPGTLDGGDVLEIGSTLLVGESGRTNADGIEQLRRIVEPLGVRVVAVPVRSVLHLKSAATALPDGTLIGYPPHVDEPAALPGLLAVPEEAGAHVVDLGGGRLLLSAGASRTAELLAARGYEPVPVEIGEFEKLEGCVTCLSVRLP
jgi:dimethylargininase